ncbi:MAG: recombination mediator RecR [Erysipelotrichaceae bacterium]|nr:recombination mediator RecR [Erysipelotrichaceae bacterium]MDY6035135.1 recombination mediator RecR [Bulleidia sp.]
MYPKSLMELIERLKVLPGVGEKTAERYAFSIMEMNTDNAKAFAQTIMDVHNKIMYCKVCGNLSENEECEICKNTQRNHRQIFVVQSPKDVVAMEKTGEYQGTYHVLNGLISSSKGIMPDDLNIASLYERLPQAEEVILGTNITMDGETTAMYLDKVIKTKYPNILVTRIAHGLPSGGMLDYADEMTLAHALADRRKMNR